MPERETLRHARNDEAEKARRLPPGLVNLCARKLSLFAEASMVHAQPSRPSQSDCKGSPCRRKTDTAGPLPNVENDSPQSRVRY
jgi:hypothetical protein